MPIMQSIVSKTAFCFEGRIMVTAVQTVSFKNMIFRHITGGNYQEDNDFVASTKKQLR